jgi:PIN domain nuclease of toxin-antitoxin system
VIVLDTHAWVWWMSDPKRLSRRAAQAIERADTIGVCTMSVFELVGRVEQGRIQLTQPARGWVHQALAHDRVTSLPLSVEVALDAAQLHFEGDPADRLIYATAMAEDAQLVTRDERLRAFDRERTVW